MTPETKDILESIAKRDKTLSAAARATIRGLIDGTAQPAATPATAIVPDDRPLLTRAQVAERLNMSEATVWRLEKAGLLVPVSMTPDCPRFLPAEVDTYLASRMAERARKHLRKQAA